MGVQLTKYSVQSGVATIALDRPEARNALSDELLDELLAAFEQARDDDAVRCVVLTSTHEKVFSAGGGPGQVAAGGPASHKNLAADRLLRPFPPIAGVRTP